MPRRKTMRNPNGYGSVYKLSGNRRRPWIARKTISWDEETGKQKYQTIGYYETRPEAMMALAEYNQNPYSIDAARITFSEVYEKFFEAHFSSGGSDSNKKGYSASFNAMAPIHDMKFVEIRVAHLESAMNDSGRNYSMKKKIRVMLRGMYKYAMKHEITEKNYADLVDIGKNDGGKKKNPFSSNEIELLFKNVDTSTVADVVLIMIFTGFRISATLMLRNENVDLENGTITGGVKTDAGKDRLVPINKKILPFIQKRYAKDKEFLIRRDDGERYKYDSFRDNHFDKLMSSLDMKHTPHDCRHTFATLLSNAEANTVSIQKLIGHSSYDMTAKVYTHKTVDELKKAIDLI